MKVKFALKLSTSLETEKSSPVKCSLKVPLQKALSQSLATQTIPCVIKASSALFNGDSNQFFELRSLPQPKKRKKSSTLFGHKRIFERVNIGRVRKEKHPSTNIKNETLLSSSKGLDDDASDNKSDSS